MKTIIGTIILVIGVLVASRWQYSPCDRAIAYRVDQVDPQFKLSVGEFRGAAEEAAGIWNKAYGTEVLNFDPKGILSVNLVFDERQGLSNQINSLEGDLKNKQSDLTPQIQAYETEVQNFQQRLAKLNEEINYWNARGGAPKEEYDKLTAEQQNLKAEAERLNNLAKELNQSTNLYNSGVTDLNQTINSFNQELNTKPEEGLFNGKENTISIYFNVSRKELVHTLAHEFGHALGMGHTEDPNSIMFAKSNQQTAPQNEDLAELKRVCEPRTVWQILKR